VGASHARRDTLHKVPGKLAWGMIAFQHAAVLDAGGHLDKMDGVYISWANQYHLRVIMITIGTLDWLRFTTTF
jgi:hypothetical protein